ncbi:putative pentamidine resistance factor, mitochondrial precursor [Metschnikowia bicuspidata var. bicuspidata NRRL YB-4993]|uniref:Putative pentamidine resistance factor, mitochondrial n=1 Tax=Metschnikowia bicuspidata var. bicuspidata NRRL YB-4993 TaxID=869754 RepID=A0A1A0H9Q4_9ASCO|nr:putative pentamidine resistance factor, mitochondrial precursor [Metschnikowia bicuspidata var. bicuspidata NRRL YB-4993]OBA20746.1 putative pentamidine resistance factor, mitochondrial precursor [Metschnikowia bicuspidata var. bicuspidata NRRL YB-4993]
MSSRGLFLYGTLRKQFLLALDRSPMLQSLWSQQTASAVNVPLTLPLSMPLKSQIYLDVALTNAGKPAVQVKAKQGLAYVKQLMRFYKHGVSAVWRNHKQAKTLMKQSYKMSGSLGRAGRETAVRVPGPRALTRHMAQHLYMNLVENRAEKAATTGDVVRAGAAAEACVSPGLLGMSRADFQLLRRTPPDFVKIPAFAVLCAIFMETTPVLCYAFPELTPLTCVLPLLLPRIWRPGPMKDLQAQMTPAEIGLVADYMMKTAYNMPPRHVRLLCAALRLKTKYVPSQMFPEFVLRKRLHDYFNYLTVDNYYLSGMNGDGNVWNLDVQELVLACLERNLVDDCKALVGVLSSGSLESRADALDALRLKLVRFIADFSSANVGYLAVGHLLESPDVKTVTKWRESGQ